MTPGCTDALHNGLPFPFHVRGGGRPLFARLLATGQEHARNRSEARLQQVRSLLVTGQKQRGLR